ncbi:38448_t:CDS:1, partial [Gigaspora margarita]
NGTTIFAKWYTTKVSTIDELLSKLYINIKTLTTIKSSNYLVTFKYKKATGPGTQLVDDHDFKKFQANY